MSSAAAVAAGTETTAPRASGLGVAGIHVFLTGDVAAANEEDESDAPAGTSGAVDEPETFREPLTPGAPPRPLASAAGAPDESVARGTFSSEPFTADDVDGLDRAYEMGAD
jgi:hypothetical protein